MTILHRAARWVAQALAATSLAAAPAPAWAAAEPLLRPAVEVDGTQITLGDLFVNAGALTDQAVLPAPAPGEEIRLSLAEAFELANAHGLGWRPVAPFEYAVVTRAWRPLDREEVLEVLEAALARAGAGANLEIDLPRNAFDIKVARGALADLSVEDTTYDPAGGRFHATLVVRDSHRRPRRQPLIGRAFAMVELPVLRARLRRDQVIEVDDLEMRRFRSDRVAGDALGDAAKLIGLSPLRVLTPGKPVRAGDIGPPTIVTKGAIVAMHLITEQMHLVAAGRAEEAGALGDAITVRNTQSRLVVDAIVTGPNRVFVRPLGFAIAAR
jgi:flagella basal body P-ring formation protein FlgA